MQQDSYVSLLRDVRKVLCRHELQFEVLASPKSVLPRPATRGRGETSELCRESKPPREGRLRLLRSRADSRAGTTEGRKPDGVRSWVSAVGACDGSVTALVLCEPEDLSARRLEIFVRLVEVFERTHSKPFHLAGSCLFVFDFELQPDRLQVLLGRERLAGVHVEHADPRAVGKSEDFDLGAR